MSNQTDFLQAASSAVYNERSIYCELCRQATDHRITYYLDGAYLTCQTCGRTTKEDKKGN